MDSEKNNGIATSAALQPFVLNDRQKWLCRHLDTLNQAQNFCPGINPSFLYESALSTQQQSNRSISKDWMAQSAHSIREITYGIGRVQRSWFKNLALKITILFSNKGHKKTRGEHIKGLLLLYQEEKQAAELAKTLNDLHIIFTNISHHMRDQRHHKSVKKKILNLNISLPTFPAISDSTFESLLTTLENTWSISIPKQYPIHKRIDDIVAAGIGKTDKHLVEILLLFNPDARQYFYAQADEHWIDWLWQNGFLDPIKEKAEDLTQYRYRTPELEYLVKVTAKVPAKVVDIMLKVPVSKEQFNPEVADRFLWICNLLHADQLARMVPKIHGEGWISLMTSFNHSGFEYEKMLKALTDAKDYDSILVLAEAILTVRKQGKTEKTAYSFATESPFYLNDISYTKVFEYLVAVDEAHKEEALVVAAKALYNVILTGGKEQDDENEIFKIEDLFHLYDVDFFDLQLGDKEPISHRDDVRILAATVKTLAMNLIGEKCDETNSQRLYKEYFESLPDSRSMWRLRLFILSLCPTVFKDQLKEAFFRIFENERPWDLILGAEYERALRVAFKHLPAEVQRAYASKILSDFVRKDIDDRDKERYKIASYDILSSIYVDLTKEERTQAKTIFGKELNPIYEPQPSIGRMQAGSVAPRAPVTQEEFDQFPATVIAQNLRSIWTPEKLRDQDKDGDTFRPINAEGVSELLRASIPKKFQEYIANATLFFERGVLDQHYTYSFLRGIQEALRDDKVDGADMNWDGLLALCISIEKSGESKPFDQESRGRDIFDGWLAGWTGVHTAIADVFQELLSENAGKTIIDFPKYRDNFLDVISYLFGYPDPVPKDETPERGDPFTMAINSVRGRTFQAFTLFVYQDGKRLPKDEASKLFPDIKKLYEVILKHEKTHALMFMFGHYLLSFYFRDKEWIHGLLPQIFPTDPTKENLYLAAWEGYVAANLFKDSFEDPLIQDLYFRAIALLPEEYTKRKYFRELDEGLATHLALAFMYFPEFDFDSPLYQAFWKGNHTKRHGDFISFIGRKFISGDDKRTDPSMKDENQIKKKIMAFWDWALEHCHDPGALKEFGFWTNTEKGMFNVAWLAEHARKTLQITGGAIAWDYGLNQSLPAFAKEAPEDTLEILRSYLLRGATEETSRWIYVDSRLTDVFRTLYKNSVTKEGTHKLINDLLPIASGRFWQLKEALDP